MTTAIKEHNGDSARRGEVLGTVELLTVPEVMSALHVSRWMVYELIRSNALAAVKIGRCRRISRGALADYLARITEEAAA